MKRDRIGTPPRLAPMQADRNGRLSEGALVEASVRARVFGIPLLRLDAAVVLTPLADAGSPAAVPAENGLADAVRSINEGADVLAELRRGARR